jgi:hypothetical protein
MKTLILENGRASTAEMEQTDEGIKYLDHYRSFGPF